MIRSFSRDETSPVNGPCTESYLNRCARVLLSARSLMATTSILVSRARSERSVFLPIRPKPFIATLIIVREFGSKLGIFGRKAIFQRCLYYFADKKIPDFAVKARRIFEVGKMGTIRHFDVFDIGYQ